VIAVALGVPAAHAQKEPTAITASQLRHMTATQFQAGIDREGVQAFVARTTQENDPHNWDEPNFDIILNHIATGNADWLRIAGEIGPFTAGPSFSDANFSKGLSVALAYALLENPAGVLRLRRADDHFLNACRYPFPQPSDAFVKHFQQRGLVALKRVHDPALKAVTEDCRKELLSPPTEKASNN
jgi:hypothetical protein